MTDLTTFWATHSDPFTAVVEQVDDWDAASPCAGWSARDVLSHVMGTQADFLAQHGHDLPEPDAADPAAAWRAHDAAVRALIADPQVAGTRYDGVFGPTTVGESLATFYGFDLLVHRWDLARSQGRDEPLTEGELDEVDAAVDGFGEHAYAPGIFAAALEPATDADRRQRVLARTGRRA